MAEAASTAGASGNANHLNNHAVKLKRSVKLKRGPPGGFDPTPLPDAPQGLYAAIRLPQRHNLAPADINIGSSDPFLTATLKAANPKRHKEDPDLTHRTRTLRCTTEPVWNEEWIVANIPPSDFSLKCRLYDEDSRDQDDRLGNVTLRVDHIDPDWPGIPPPGRAFTAKKRVISKRALLLKAVGGLLRADADMTSLLIISIELLGASDPPHAQMYTMGPTTWIKHLSPMIGRIFGTKVNAEDGKHRPDQDDGSGRDQKDKPKSQKYDFQAIEMQLQCPVPPKLYHRYVEFRPFVGLMFASNGIRGKILNTALHKQHERIYNFDESTEYGDLEPCSEQAALQFLRLAHLDEGGRVFTYILTLDGLLRFTETGKEFGIDLLSKHTMHSNVAKYIACSGEFFIRRLKRQDAPEKAKDKDKTGAAGKGAEEALGQVLAPKPANYQLIIDNDSGTYRPNKSILPDLKAFLERNLPGLDIDVRHCEDEELQALKEKQRNIKKKEGRIVNVVMKHSQSSISSAESELDRHDETWEQGQKSKREAAYAAMEDPTKIKDMVGSMVPRTKKEQNNRKA